jgi:hypothetical protein
MSASRDTFDIKDVWQNKRGVVILVGALVLLAIASGVYFMFFANANNPDAATLPVPGSPAGPGAPGTSQIATRGNAPPAGSGFPGAANAPGAPGAAASGAPLNSGSTVTSKRGTTAMGVGSKKTGLSVSTQQAVVATAPRDSFADAPIGYGGAAGGATSLGSLNAPGAPVALGTSPTSGGSGAAAGPKPAPIRPNVAERAARKDPFIPFYHFIVMEPPASSFIVAERLASRPKPPVVIQDIPPEEKFGPLPQVERRVAGILYDGSVSAILETGTPGSADTRVDVIQPGSTVPSGAPNIEDLTVASITPTQVVLRAQDGRTATIKLSNVSAAYADAFHSATNGPATGSGGQQQGGRGGGPNAPLRPSAASGGTLSSPGN